MKRILTILGVTGVAAFAAACGFETADQACRDAGTAVDPSAKVYRDDDGSETRCLDGREVENAGDGMGWTVDD